MGLLSQGTPLEWEPSKEHIAHVKAEGIKQFVHAYNTHKGSRNTVLKWGDEVEYTLVIKDQADGNYKLFPNAPALLAKLEEAESQESSATQVLWHPEYSNWQIEGTPAEPYRCYVTDLLLVEPNMKLRRAAVQALLGDDPLGDQPRLHGCPEISVPASRTRWAGIDVELHSR
eukprot:SAG11_NODE_8180_length_1051_cov_0.973739_2_plen_172_part_00